LRGDPPGHAGSRLRTACHHGEVLNLGLEFHEEALVLGIVLGLEDLSSGEGVDRLLRIQRVTVRK